MRSAKKVVFVAVLAMSLFAMAGTAWAWDGSIVSDPTPDPAGISWETNPTGLV